MSYLMPSSSPPVIALSHWDLRDQNYHNNEIILLAHPFPPGNIFLCSTLGAAKYSTEAIRGIKRSMFVVAIKRNLLGIPLAFKSYIFLKLLVERHVV